MKILIVKAQPNPTSLSHLAVSLKRRGHNVSFMGPSEHGELQKLRVEGIPVFLNKIFTSKAVRRKLSWEYFKLFFQFVKFLRKESFDVLLLNLPNGRFFGRLASIFSVKILVVSIIRGRDGLFERWINWLDDATVCVSDDAKKFLAKRYYIPTNKITIIPNGIDIARMDKIPEDKFYLHRELGIDFKTKLIGMFAYFYRPRGKGQEFFLDAAKIVSEQFQNVRFILIGTNIEPGFTFREYCENYAKNIGIHDRVFFIGERLDGPSILSSL
ncbi:MAG: glycosyltransferase, partial [Candidatus Omnitrophica bacterium]|nr:glycosyltransferase [Candidatus Omnitrophota bacterium]